MIFDKTQAMRNAERHLVQGKIKAAIDEYKQVVKHDAKDFSTLNMLGDLYSKNSQIKEAVRCYTSVAEHYSEQGFAQKGIAIYKKIFKLEPGSIEISEKLAELYKQKGSLTEAKSHYTTLAEHYEKKGQMIDALGIWKQIAMLDPKNTEVYLTIANSYLKENQTEDAADAFAESGLRLAKSGDHLAALESFTSALELKQDDAKILSGYVESMFGLGKAPEAAARLGQILESQPNNRDTRFLLVDCYIESGNTAEAESAVIKLVEQEPASYPKLLNLAGIYLSQKDLDSATRMLTMASEHSLVGGHADEFYDMLATVLAARPEQIDALRLMTRYCSWQRDDAALMDSLVKLYGAAKAADSIDDERYALTQLVMVLPQEVEYSERLKEINAGYGFDDVEISENLFERQVLNNGFDISAVPVEFAEPQQEEIPDYSFEPTAVVAGKDDSDIVSTGASQAGISGLEIAGQAFEEFAAGDGASAFAPDTTDIFGEMDASDFVIGPSDDTKLQKEVESIEFYIENGYIELAGKAITDLHAEFGDRPEIHALKAHLAGFESTGESFVVEAPPVPAAQLPVVEASGFDLNDLRNELGIEDDGNLIDDSDYDTHFHTAVAYQEMGLTEEAIKEFQLAIALVTPNDGTRRFFSCSNLLGHCFMEKGMPNLAQTWFQRTLETPGLTDDEKQGLWYELAGAFEAEGDVENAGKYFEQVYAENINFRDVSERVRSIAVNH